MPVRTLPRLLADLPPGVEGIFNRVMRIVPVDDAVKIGALQRSAYFSGLPSTVLAELAQDLTLRSYQQGEIICWQGEMCPGLYILERGSVKLFKLSAKGRELVIRVLVDGAIFNDVPVFDGGPTVVNVAALEDSYIWVLERSTIQKAVRAHPEVAQGIIINLAQNLRRMIGLVEELSFYQVTNRLARLLSGLSEVELQGTKDQRLTQDEMAARLGTVREVVARSVRELSRSGAIHVKRGRIEIINRAVLDEWAKHPED